jgi:hypothetical protein
MGHPGAPKGVRDRHPTLTAADDCDVVVDTLSGRDPVLPVETEQAQRFLGCQIGISAGQFIPTFGRLRRNVSTWQEKICPLSLRESCSQSTLIGESE